MYLSSYVLYLLNFYKHYVHSILPWLKCHIKRIYVSQIISGVSSHLRDQGHQFDLIRGLEVV